MVSFLFLERVFPPVGVDDFVFDFLRERFGKVSFFFYKTPSKGRSRGFLFPRIGRRSRRAHKAPFFSPKEFFFDLIEAARS